MTKKTQNVCRLGKYRVISKEMSARPVPLVNARALAAGAPSPPAKKASWGGWVAFLIAILVLIGLSVWMAFYFRAQREKCKEKNKVNNV